MLGFWIKKAISAALLPIPSALLAMLLGWLLLRKLPRLGKALLVLGPCYLLLLSFSPVSVWLADSLESRYAPYANQPVDYVLVLGSGHHSVSGRSPMQQLSATARGRLLEGLRVWQANPQAVLVVSGYGGMDPVPQAQVMRQAAIDAGVPSVQIIAIDSAKDTQEEANETAKLVGQQPMALVTSATHLHRALASYHHAGLQPLPAPADFIATPTRSWYLSAQNLWVSQRVLHEYLGLLWLWLRS